MSARRITPSRIRASTFFSTMIVGSSPGADGRGAAAP
jgi:hypothetical protein